MCRNSIDRVDTSLENENNFVEIATINQIAPGNYFLLGMSQMGKTGTVWNLPISLKPGHNKLSLTLGNATWSN